MWRSRLAGRGRTTGNRVTDKTVREFESLLLRQNRKPPLGGFLFWLEEIRRARRQSRANVSGTRWQCHSGADGDGRGAERRMKSQRMRRNLSFYGVAIRYLKGSTPLFSFDKKTRPILWSVFFVVTRRGVEPLPSPWEGDVLATWLTGRIKKYTTFGAICQYFLFGILHIFYAGIFPAKSISLSNSAYQTTTHHQKDVSNETSLIFKALLP